MHAATLPLPLDLARPPAVVEALARLATEAGGEAERGAVFTRPAVVHTILDLCGYTADQPLAQRRLLEPSAGHGDFLLPAVHRLLTSYRAHGGDPSQAMRTLGPAIRAVELHQDSVATTQARLEALLTDFEIPPAAARALCAEWLINDDFLQVAGLGPFDCVVGNPPYVRQERIPGPLLNAYRAQFETLYDRADLYVLFYERGLDLLTPGGRLGFICANRWIKNKYGAVLRAKIHAGYHLEHYIDLEGADVFGATVDAYPAITILRRGAPGPTRAAHLRGASESDLDGIAAALLAPGPAPAPIHQLETVTHGRDPWLLDVPDVLPILRRLERSLPTLEEAGARIGIGVATGADAVFIGDYAKLPVEDARKLPLATAGDLDGPRLTWRGKGIINPWDSDGLAPLGQHPRFDHYLQTHAEALHRRHVARKAPHAWYRTIDRITPELTRRPKLLIPDIKGGTTVAYDPGEYYPHHNLYVVTSDLWDLQALQAILRSSYALAFVAAYCVRMAGGFLRFQAQYLRRIRVPHQGTLSPAQRAALIAHAASPDQAALDAAVRDAYALPGDEARRLETFAAETRV